MIKNFRADFRVVFFAATTLLIYAIWFAGRLLTTDARSWRAAVFSKWAQATARIAGMRIKVRGTPPPSNSFLVSNHLGYMNIAAFAATLECFFVAKSEVRDWFVVGKLAASIGTIFINRQNRRDISRATAEISRKFAAGESLVLFPEGTSSNGATVLPFKSSFLEFAARGDRLVYYASITYQMIDKNADAGRDICWWGDAEFLPHLWRLFQIKSFDAIIAFGGETEKGANRKELAANLRNKVGEIFTPIVSSCSDGRD